MRESVYQFHYQRGFCVFIRKTEEQSNDCRRNFTRLQTAKKKRISNIILTLW